MIGVMTESRVLIPPHEYPQWNGEAEGDRRAHEDAQETDTHMTEERRLPYGDKDLLVDRERRLSPVMEGKGPDQPQDVGDEVPAEDEAQKSNLKTAPPFPDKSVPEIRGPNAFIDI